MPSMVGFDPKTKVHLSHLDYAVAGGISGGISRVLFQPLDVLKIRFQLQVEPISKTSSKSKYRGLRHATSTIVKEEGWKALWKGHVPAQLLSVGYGIVQFTSFEIFTQFAWKLVPEKYLTTNLNPVIHTLCGGAAGCVATLCVHPIDVIRTRLIAQGEPKIYKTIFDAFGKIYCHEGIAGFYKGVIPAFSQVGPQMGLQFGFYALFTDLISLSKDSYSLPDAGKRFICGTGAGVMAKIIIYPLDVIKKRLQIQGFERAKYSFGDMHIYSGLVNCFNKIIREESVRGLYKGLSPSLIKAGAVAGTNLCVYDQICQILLFTDR